MAQQLANLFTRVGQIGFGVAVVGGVVNSALYNVIFAESLEVLVMALEALHEEAKPLRLEVSWLKTKVQVFGDLLDEAVHTRSSWSSSPLTVVRMRQFSPHWSNLVLLAGLDWSRPGWNGAERLAKTVAARD
ncbi:Protein l(2)37Cc [Chionoecetes opilio]|uniref:Protein l(2)37Cc n=1 Tax=Chionoecetes opilio TaxID=41210 RepID=A0A8J4Y2F4_CHIOP|nr:Protein l(2)37Cc [Chionoecetes opilio]